MQIKNILYTISIHCLHNFGYLIEVAESKLYVVRRLLVTNIWTLDKSQFATCKLIKQ